MSPRRPSPFGELLRHWRARRGASQLDLALEAGISTRHLSFVETGRSRPSRDMVVRLCAALDVPLRERNALLAAAGFAPLYRETPLPALDTEPVGRVLAFLLERHDPFPAYLVDRGWSVLRANASAGRSLAPFATGAEIWREQPPNLLRLMLHPEGLRPYVVNWEEAASFALDRLQREIVVAGEDDPLASLRDEILQLPDLPRPGLAPDPDARLPPVLPLHLKRDALELRLFTTITTLGTPLDVTLAELRIESLMPADDATEALLRALAARG